MRTIRKPRVPVESRRKKCSEAALSELKKFSLMTAPLQKTLGIKSQDRIEESYGAFSRAWERKAWRIAPERIIV